jgi:hypothetical protein
MRDIIGRGGISMMASRAGGEQSGVGDAMSGNVECLRVVTLPSLSSCGLDGGEGARGCPQRRDGSR